MYVISPSATFTPVKNSFEAIKYIAYFILVYNPTWSCSIWFLKFYLNNGVPVYFNFSFSILFYPKSYAYNKRGDNCIEVMFEII